MLPLRRVWWGRAAVLGKRRVGRPQRRDVSASPATRRWASACRSSRCCGTSGRRSKRRLRGRRVRRAAALPHYQQLRERTAPYAHDVRAPVQAASSVGWWRRRQRFGDQAHGDAHGGDDRRGDARQRRSARIGTTAMVRRRPLPDRSELRTARTRPARADIEPDDPVVGRPHRALRRAARRRAPHLHAAARSARRLPGAGRRDRSDRRRARDRRS